METNAMGNSPPIQVLIVDDHPAVRKGLALLFEPEGIRVCAEAQACAEAIALAEEHKPDLVLVDLSLGDEDGLALLAELSERSLRSLVYSMHEDGHSVQTAIAAGAFGYVTKREMHEVLIDAMGEVAAGRRFVSPRAVAALTEYIAERGTNAAHEDLSSQEREVYRLLGAGETTSGIAAAMNISPHTVESYYARIREKLELGGMRELRRHAIAYFQKRTS